MEWAAPGIVLSAQAFGEGDVIASVFTEAQGVYRGLGRGGAGRKSAHLWQPGNLVEARWVARLADQLGTLTAEMVHPVAALAMQQPESLAVLAAACAVTEGALPEREAFPPIFRGMLHLVVHCGEPDAVENLVRFELGLLAQLGYGLDLSACAVTGVQSDLAYVSPRTGRAVSDAAAGLWREKLLRLPPFLCGGEDKASGEDVQDGLRLTGHFLARDVFGVRHQPLPTARTRLMERLQDQSC